MPQKLPRSHCSLLKKNNGPSNLVPRTFSLETRQWSIRRCIFLNLHLQAWKNMISSPQSTLVYHHRLECTGTKALLSENQNGNWRCAVCKSTSDTLNQPSYHCFTCNDFDICRDCFEPKRHPSHKHELNLVNTSLVYEQRNGCLVCDICGNESRWYEKYVVILVFTDAISFTGISNGQFMYISV